MIHPYCCQLFHLKNYSAVYRCYVTSPSTLTIGRALMSRPKLLMLDEPSEGLSPIYTSNVFDTLKILEEQGLTILLVSQEVERSLELSHRTYVLENGQITVEGKSSDLLNDDKVRESYLGM